MTRTRSFPLFLTGLLLVLAAAQPSRAHEPALPVNGECLVQLPQNNGVETEIIFLVDGSGSIEPDDWTLQQEALKQLVLDRARLPIDGTIALGLMQYSTETDPDTGESVTLIRQEMCLHPIDHEVDTFIFDSSVRRMKQIGSATSSGDAIEAAANAIFELGDVGATDKRICLLTDGAPNVGVDALSASTTAQGLGVDRLNISSVRDRDRFTAEDAEAAYGGAVFGGGLHTFSENAPEFTALLLDNCTSPPMKLRAIEVNQSIQDWDGVVRMVKEKATIARVFLEPSACPANPNAVTTSARLWMDRGMPEERGPILPFNADGRAIFDCDASDLRSDPSTSLNFWIPKESMVGQLTLTVELPGGIDCGDGTVVEGCNKQVSMQTPDFPVIDFISIPSRIGFDPRVPGRERPVRIPSIQELMVQESRMEAMLPVADLGSSYDLFEGRPADGAEWRFDTEDMAWKLDRVDSQVNEHLKWYFWKTRCDLSGCPTDFLHGVAHPSAGVVGISNPDGVKVSIGNLGDTTNEFGKAGHYRNVATHEVAHNFGVPHTTRSSRYGFNSDTGLPLGPCGSQAGLSQSDSYPYLSHYLSRENLPRDAGERANIGPTFIPSRPEDEIWGVATNVFDWENNLFLALADPNDDWALMSYCSRDVTDIGQNWISLLNYPLILDLALTTDWDERQPPHYSDSDTWIVVRGRLRTILRDVVLDPFYATPAEGPIESEPGDYTIELLDDTGGVLASESFATTPLVPEDVYKPEFPEETADLPAEETFFLTLLAPASPIAEVVIREGAEELARVAASAAAPQVVVTAPAPGATLDEDVVRFAWNASDADGDPLFHALDYSTDGGSTWVPLAVDLEDSELDVGREWLRASDNAVLRVTTSDGFRSTSAVSAPFTVANNRPVVVIASPVEDQEFVASQRIPLQATAFDREDGHLPDESIEWRSSRNGSLGFGAKIDVGTDTLAEGEHLIVARALDSEGLAGGDAAKIFVSRLGRFAGLEPDFSMRMDPRSAVVNPGERIEFRVYVNGVNGFTDAVSLQAIDLPAGWTASLSPSVVTPDGFSVLRVNVPADATEESVPIVVEGTSGDLVHTTASTTGVLFGLIPACYGRIAGIVRDFYTGLPVEGADAGHLGSLEPTDAAGYFESEDIVPRTTYAVRVHKDGYYSKRINLVEVRCDDVTTFEIDLVPVRYGSLTGRVVEGVLPAGGGAVMPTATPIEGAEVQALVNTQTDANGDYTLTQIPLDDGTNDPKTYNVRATAPGYWDQGKLQTVTQNGPQMLDFELVERCEVTVSGSGMAVDGDGLPLAGVEVIPEGSAFPGPLGGLGGLGTSVTSGPDGSFELPQVSTFLNPNNAPRDFEIRANAPNPELFPSVSIDYEKEIDQCGENRIDNILVTVTYPFIPQDNFTRVQGTIRDSVTGEPVPDVRVLIRSLIDADDNGFYEEEIYVGSGTDTTETLRVEVWESEFHWEADGEEFLAVADQVHVMDFDVLPKDFMTVEGTVRDVETGAPLEGFEVRVSARGFVEAVTDASGFYRAENVTPDPGNEGRFIHVSSFQNPSGSNGGVRYFSNSETTFGEPGTTIVQDLDLLRECDGGAISGVVVNAATLDPLEGALVQWWPSSDTYADLTDIDGRFRIESIPPRTDNGPRQVEIRASKTGFITASKLVTIFCGAEIFLEFGAPVGGFGEVFGTVTDEDTGEPIPDIFVGSGFGGGATTDANGDYTLPNAPLQSDGSPRVWTITATRGLDVQNADVTVAADGPTRQDFQFASLPAFSLAVGDEHTAFDPATRTLTSTSTLTVTNDTSDAIQGPIAATILIDTAGVDMPTAGGEDVSGNPVYLVVDETGSLDAGASTAIELEFTRPAPLAFLYDVQLTQGDPSVEPGAAPQTALGVLPRSADGDGDLWHDALDVCPGQPDPDQQDSDQDGVGDACETLPPGADPEAPEARIEWVRLTGDAPAGATSVTFGYATATVDESGRYEIATSLVDLGDSVDLVFSNDSGVVAVRKVDITTSPGDVGVQ